MQLIDIINQQPVLSVHQRHMQGKLGRPFHKLARVGLIIVTSHKGVDDHVQFFHTALEGQQRGREHFHIVGGFFCRPANFINGTVGSRAALRLLCRTGCNTAKVHRRISHALQNGAHHRTGIGGPVCRLNAQLGGFVHGQHVAPRFILNGLNGLFHFLGGTHGLFGQFAHLVGNHCKAAPGFTGAGSLDGRVEGQQVGLVGHLIDDAHDLTNIAGLFAQTSHGFLELHNGVAHAVNGSHGPFNFLLTRGRIGAGTLGAF